MIKVIASSYSYKSEVDFFRYIKQNLSLNKPIVLIYLNVILPMILKHLSL